MPTSCFVLLALTVGSQATISKPPSLVHGCLSLERLSGSRPAAVPCFLSIAMPEHAWPALRGRVSGPWRCAHRPFRAPVSLVDIEFGPDGTFQLRHEKPNYIFLTPFVCYSQKRERIKGQKQRLGY